MSKASDTLTRALSKGLQATVRGHVMVAAALLDPVELMVMPMIATVEASGGAIASYAATIGNAEGADEARINEIVWQQIQRHHDMLVDGVQLIIAEAMAAISAEKARAA